MNAKVTDINQNGERITHVHHTDWTNAVIGVAVAAALAGAIWSLCWLGVSVTRADREMRSTRLEQCAEIESESMRTLCVANA